MKDGLIISILGISVVFLGLAFIAIVISIKAYFFQKKKTIKVKNFDKITSIEITDEVSVAIGLSLYFYDLFNKSWQDEVTIQKLTPPISSWVFTNRAIQKFKNISFDRRKWK